MTDEPANDVAVMVVRLWEQGGTLAALVGRLQEHQRRADALAREAEALRLELTDILRQMYIGGDHHKPHRGELVRHEMPHDIRHSDQQAKT